MLSAIDHIESDNLPLLRFTPRALSHPILHIDTNKNYIPISAQKDNLL